MKRLQAILAVLAVLFFFVFALVGAMYMPKARAQASAVPVDRATRIEHVRETLQAELDGKGKGGKVLVEDSGKDIDVGAGDGPLVIVKLPSHGRECLVALHPTDQNLMATLGCDDVPPALGL